jgi:hypothetical protein
VDVQVERRAVMQEATCPHRPIFWKRVAGRLPLKAQAVESIPCGGQGAVWVQEHEVNDALPSATRSGGAADVFNRKIGRVRQNQGGDLLGNVRCSGIVIATNRRLISVRADH